MFICNHQYYIDDKYVNVLNVSIIHNKLMCYTRIIINLCLKNETNETKIQFINRMNYYLVWHKWHKNSSFQHNDYSHLLTSWEI